MHQYTETRVGIAPLTSLQAVSGSGQLIHHPRRKTYPISKAENLRVGVVYVAKQGGSYEQQRGKE